MEDNAARGVRRGWFVLLVVVAATFAFLWIWLASAGAGPDRARAVLHDLHGNVVGRVTFLESDHEAHVRVFVGGLPAGFHGFHVHVRGLCDAADGFASVGPHYDHAGREQPFDGELPPLLVGANGSASSSFTTDRFTVSEVEGMALVVHAYPDNFANVPIGNAKNEYWPNGPRAVAKTSATGNAGAPIACGVIRKAS